MEAWHGPDQDLPEVAEPLPEPDQSPVKTEAELALDQTELSNSSGAEDVSISFGTRLCLQQGHSCSNMHGPCQLSIHILRWPF